MLYTDLAIESAAMLKSTLKRHIPGISLEESRGSHQILTTTITVTTKEASLQLHKPCGTYITIETPELLSEELSAAEATSEAIAAELRTLIPFHDRLKVLIAGIGNEKITPDALGPHTISKVRVTRHLFLTYEAESDSRMANVSAIHPGVMAQTGIETADLIRRLIDLVHPEVLIVVDSLAARELERMNTTIQITDTGIAPGAGTKNNRAHITKETVGCRVIALGVPTVIHCQALLNDPEAPDMIVTATNIDQVIHQFSTVISEALNRVLHPGLDDSERRSQQ